MGFTSEITELDGVRLEIRVTVDVEQTRTVLREITRKIARQAKLSGFRPGKAPVSLVKSRYKDVLRQEVVEKLVRNTYREALRDAGIDPIHLGDIREVDLPEDGPLSYTGTFEIAPQFELGDYEGIEVERPDCNVSDEEVEAQIDSMREAHAILEPAARETPEGGDFVLCDFIQAPLGEGQEPVVEKDIFLVAGDDGHFEELNAALLSGSVGETVSFEVTYPEKHPDASLRGREVGFKIRIKGIKTKILPELDDDFVKENTPAASVEDLRAKTREELERLKERASESAVKDRILTKLLETHEFQAPPSLVKEQASHDLRARLRDLAGRGMDPRRLSVDWEEEFKNHLILGDRRVKAHFLLEKIAVKEGIEICDDDVEAEIQTMAAHAGQPPQTIRSELEGADRLSVLKESILRRKTLEFLVERASITGEESA